MRTGLEFLRRSRYIDLMLSEQHLEKKTNKIDIVVVVVVEVHTDREMFGGRRSDRSVAPVVVDPTPTGVWVLRRRSGSRRGVVVVVAAASAPARGLPVTGLVALGAERAALLLLLRRRAAFRRRVAANCATTAAPGRSRRRRCLADHVANEVVGIGSGGHVLAQRLRVHHFVVNRNGDAEFTHGAVHGREV